MSQASQSQNSVANFKLVAEKCVSYIINRDSCKIPIKRSALLKFINAFNLIEYNTRNFEAILALTNSTLKEVYGYKLVQIDSKGGIQYIAVLNEDTAPPHEVDRKNHGNNALLVLSLIHIYMSGGSLKEDALWRFLEKCGIMNQNDINAKKTLTSVFTKQAYLTYNKVGEGDYAKYVFEWGPRANEEFPKLKLLEKLGEVFDRAPDYWFEQHKKAAPPNANIVEDE